jgi:glutathione S-transferase
MAVKLHRCPVMWPKTDRHPCYRVQLALDEAGVAYEIVKEPLLPRGRRKDVIEHTGQSHLPAIELEDGSWWREDSAEMAEAIRAGRLSAAPDS